MRTVLVLLFLAVLATPALACPPGGQWANQQSWGVPPWQQPWGWQPGWGGQQWGGGWPGDWSSPQFAPQQFGWRQPSSFDFSFQRPGQRIYLGAVDSPFPPWQGGGWGGGWGGPWQQPVPLPQGQWAGGWGAPQWGAQPMPFSTQGGWGGSPGPFGQSRSAANG